MSGDFSGRRWPTQAEELALRAALAAPGQRAELWQEWRRRYDFDDMWSDVTKVLPLLSRRMAAEPMDAGDRARVRGVYRRTWYENQRLLAAGIDAVRALQRAGVSPVLLKGVPLIACWYQDSGARPIGDVDVLVRPEEIETSVAVLAGLGYRPDVPIKPPAAETFELVHGVGFSAGPLAHVDLHTHSLEECCYAGADAGLFARAVPFELQDLTALRPSATDLLLTVCVHGVRGAPVRVVHWVADAVILLQGEEPIEWDLLVREARRRGVAFALGRSLSYVAKTLDAPIPPRVLGELERGRHWPLERLDFAIQGRAPGAGWMALRDVMRYLRTSRRWRPMRRATGFPGYLEALWGKDHWWDLPPEAWRRFRARTG